MLLLLLLTFDGFFGTVFSRDAVCFPTKRLYSTLNCCCGNFFCGVTYDDFD